MIEQVSCLQATGQWDQIHGRTVFRPGPEAVQGCGPHAGRGAPVPRLQEGQLRSHLSTGVPIPAGSLQGGGVWLTPNPPHRPRQVPEGAGLRPLKRVAAPSIMQAPPSGPERGRPPGPRPPAAQPACDPTPSPSHTGPQRRESTHHGPATPLLDQFRPMTQLL